jgi:hypothetical protein
MAWSTKAAATMASIEGSGSEDLGQRPREGSEDDGGDDVDRRTTAASIG